MRGSPWIPIAALFVFVLYASAGISGLRHWIEPLNTTVPYGGEASTDQFLGILEVARPAEKLDQEFRQWDPKAQFLFVASAKQPFWRQTYYTLTYLAYPRQISAVVCPDQNAYEDEIHKELSPNFDGLIFFDVPPGPWRNGARQIGPRLYISHYHDGSPAWKSFCP